MLRVAVYRKPEAQMTAVDHEFLDLSAPRPRRPMTKSIATGSINRETAVALIDAAIAAARAIGIPAAVPVRRLADR
jgi:hypothetical protein